jgi:hypothetical protein
MTSQITKTIGPTPKAAGSARLRLRLRLPIEHRGDAEIRQPELRALLKYFEDQPVAAAEVLPA